MMIIVMIIIIYFLCLEKSCKFVKSSYTFIYWFISPTYTR